MKLVEKPIAYEFDRFRLDVANRLLWRDGEVVPLTSKVFDTLLFFVENSDRLLTKDEVMMKREIVVKKPMRRRLTPLPVIRTEMVFIPFASCCK